MGSSSGSGAGLALGDAGQRCGSRTTSRASSGISMALMDDASSLQAHPVSGQVQLVGVMGARWCLPARECSALIICMYVCILCNSIPSARCSSSLFKRLLHQPNLSFRVPLGHSIQQAGTPEGVIAMDNVGSTIEEHGNKGLLPLAYSTPFQCGCCPCCPLSASTTAVATMLTAQCPQAQPQQAVDSAGWDEAEGLLFLLLHQPAWFQLLHGSLPSAQGSRAM
ncbi:hypothetical protein V8C86DRAFT_1618465 [Haematococcus lacustris]